MYSSSMTLRQGYSALQTQMASIHPSSAQMAEYTPTNLPPSSCRNLTVLRKSGEDNQTTQLVVSANEAPEPNKRLCSCMLNSAGCLARRDNNPNATEFNLRIKGMCQQNELPCDGVGKNSTTGIYGSYSMCDHFQSGTWVLNQLYNSQRNNASACSAYGGVTQQPTPLESQDSDCQILLRQAGPQGTGTVTYFPPIATKLRSSDSDKRGPLTRASRIGIGVGVVMGACVAIAGIIAFCYRARRKARIAAEKAELDGKASSIDPPAQLDGDEVMELGGGETLEMGSEGEVCELPGEVASIPAELEAPTSKLACQSNTP